MCQALGVGPEWSLTGNGGLWKGPWNMFWRGILARWWPGKRGGRRKRAGILLPTAFPLVF